MTTDRTNDGEGPREAPDGESRQASTERAATAPHPDDPRKPDAPPDIPGPGWLYTARKAFREFLRDQVTDLAAALTYWAVLAIAPALLALVSILSLVTDGEEAIQNVLDFAEELGLPDNALSTIEPILDSLSGQQGAGLGAIVAVLIALWSASGYVNAFGRAMNRIYEIDEGRGIVKLRASVYLLTVALLVLVALIIAMLVLSGPVADAVGSVIGLGSTAVMVWNIAKWPVILVLVALTIAMLYYFTPNVRQPRFRWVSVGSVIAILVWALATAGLALYLTTFGGGSSYQQTYGALAGVIIFLLWIWLTNNALLFGAEVDAELERTRELVGGIEAEEVIQLPPKDTRASEKKQKQHAEDVADGRELRRAAQEARAGDTAPRD